MTATIIDRDAVYICAVPFASQHGDYMFKARVRGSDPGLAANPSAFVLDGTPEQEWPTPFDRLVDDHAAREAAEREERQRRFEQAAKANPVKLAAPTVTCVRDFMALHDGRPALIRKGSTQIAGSQLVVAHPDNWS